MCSLIRKIRAPIKIKSALPPPPRFCAFFPAKMACRKAQNCAESCKNVQKALLCNTPFSYTRGKKRGVENLTNDTPPKKGFWTPPRTVRFPPPSGVGALFFLYKIPRQSRPEALLEGSKNFRESAFSGTFSSPHTFCTPPYHGPITYQKNPRAHKNKIGTPPPPQKKPL